MDQSKTYLREEATVDLFDLARRLLIEWRRILIIALVMGGVLYLAYQWKNSKAQTASEAEDQKVSQTTEESIRAELTNDELNAVLLAVQQNQQINARMEYLNGSVWMQDGSELCQRLYIILQLSGEEIKGNYLKRIYGNYYYSDAFAEKLANLIGNNISYAHVSDLVSEDLMINGDGEEFGETTYMALGVVLPNEVDAVKAINLIKEGTLDFQKDLTADIGKHEVKILSSEVRERYDQSPPARRRDMLYEINNLKAQLQAVTEVFSTKQRLLYEKLTNNISDDELTAVSTSTKKGYGKGRFLAGIALSIFLYICVSVLFALVTTRIHSKKELLGLPYLGELRMFQALSKWDGLSRSRIVYGWLYKHCSDVEKMTQMVYLKVKEAGISKISLVHCGKTVDSMCECKESICRILKMEHLETDVLELNDDHSIMPLSF